MNRIVFIKKYEELILEVATSEEDENRLLEMLDEIDDKLRELDHEINQQLDAYDEKLNYENMNEDFVYQNCLPNNVFNIDDYRK